MDSTERARVEKDMASAKDLGLIQVHIKKGVSLGHSSDPSRTRKHDSEGCATNLAEKALKGKAISHGTSLVPPPWCCRHSADQEKGSPTANVSQRLLKLRSIGSMEADCLRRLAGERVRDMKVSLVSDCS